MTTYLQYNDPVIITWRKGTAEDPFVDITEHLQIVNGKIVLHEIPDSFTRVTVTGYNEITSGEPAPNQYRVNYNNGIVYFNPSEEGKVVEVSYKGRGFILYPAERIYAHSHDRPDVIRNLQDIIDEGLNVLNVADEFNHKGDWEATTQYKQRNVVVRGNAAYMAVKDSIGIDPATDDGTYWKKVVDVQPVIDSANDTIAALQSAATDATNAANAANTAAANATSAADSANTAAANANNAADVANAAATNANNAAAAANAAADAANAAAANANAAKDAANTAAANANTAADNANTATVNLVHKGAYNPSTTYYPRNIVTYQGSSYMCIQQCQGILPTDTNYWQPVAIATGIVWRGKYNPTTTYNINDAVEYNGSAYVCIQNGTVGVEPTDASKWSMMAQSGAVITWKGSYNPTTTYDAYDIVEYNGSTYICLEDGTVGIVPTDTSKWGLLTSKGQDGISFRWKGDFSVSTTYNANDVVFYQGSAYICKVDGTVGIEPTQTSHWDLMVRKGDVTDVDEMLIKKTGDTMVGDLAFDASTFERRIEFNLGATYGNIGFFGRPSDGVVGMYDWKNMVTVFSYNPVGNEVSFNEVTKVKAPVINFGDRFQIRYDESTDSLVFEVV